MCELFSGLCRFAFLEYEDKSAAQEALQNDKMELDGRTLSVNFAKPRGSGGGGGGGGRRGIDQLDCVWLWEIIHDYMWLWKSIK